MKTKLVLASLTAITVLLLASTAMAQAPRNALSPGQNALSFQVPAGGNPYVAQQGGGGASGLSGLFGLLTSAGNSSVLGYHRMFTENIRGGLNLGLQVTSTTPKSVGGDGEITEGDGSTAFGLTIAPQLNYYTSTRGTVAPYFFGQVLFSTFSDGSDTTTGDFAESVDDAELAYNPQEAANLNLALGYGVEWFPVTRFSISGQIGLNVNVLSPDQPNDAGDAVIEQGFGINLFTSALAANIYF